MDVIDIRDPESFAKSHLKGAINIPMGASFRQWASVVLDDSQELLVIALDEQQGMSAVEMLLRTGFEHVVGHSTWDENEGRPNVKLEGLPVISVMEAARQMEAEKPLCIIDVRTAAEWNAGHIVKAMHVPLSTIRDSLDSIPRDSDIGVICGSGYRSSVAASFLKKAGFERVKNIQGGMHAWDTYCG